MTTVTASEHAAIRAVAGELAHRELAPRAAALDVGDREAAAECWRLLVELGFDRVLLDERHGGAGLAAADLLVALEELAAGDGGVAMCVLLCNAALATLTDEQLAEVPDGARWAIVPTAAADVTVTDGRLGGAVRCALGADAADGLVILAGQREPEAWVLPGAAPGLRSAADKSQMGLRSAPAASVELSGVAAAPGSASVAGGVSAAALLRAGTAAIARGIERRAYELALEYAGARQQGGAAIIEYDAVSDMLAAMAVRIRCRAPIAVAEPEAIAAKVAATDAAVASATDAVQVFGGAGYMVETGVEKLMRDAKYCQLFPEPNWVAADELMARERSQPT